MRRYPTLIVLTALFLAATSLAQAGQQFRYKFEQGDTLVYEMRVKSKGSSTLPGGRASSFFFDSKTTVELKCLAVMGDTYRVAVKVLKAAVNQNGTMKAPPKPETRIVTVDGTGRMIGGEGDPVLTILPDRTLSVGDSFSSSGGKGEGSLKTRTVYTLSREDGRLKGYRGQVAMFKADTQMHGGKPQEQVKSRSSGNLFFDVAKGRLVRQDRTATFMVKHPIKIGEETKTMLIKHKLVMRQRLLSAK